MPTAYLSPSLLRELTDVSVSNPGAGEAGRLLTWNGTAFVLRTSSESRTDLGLGTLATQSASNVSITGGNITGLSSFSVENVNFNPIQIRRINTNQFAQGLSFYKGRIGAHTLSGDQLVRVMAFGSIESGNFPTPSANQDFLTAYAADDFTSTSQPRDIRFFTVNTGTITAIERLRIEPTGQVRIIPAHLQATSTTSGALVVAGGVGVGGAIHGGSSLTLATDASAAQPAIVAGTNNGLKIGTATSQKLGFFNATPVVQPTTGVAEAAYVENSGGVNVNDDSTFDGYTLRQVVKALRNLGILA